MPRPIALLTDFGTRDAYVGIMKGVMLALCPTAQLFDLTHEVPPQDVVTGALHLRSAAPYCPEDTVFLAVVDPGVGSARRPICVRSGGRLFVGPDNGLLWPAAEGVGSPQAYHLNRPEYWLPESSSTFHGRDIFAPVAARLAMETPPDHVGSSVDDAERFKFPLPVQESGGIRGEVLCVDHFGNLITNLRPEDVNYPEPESASFVVGSVVIQGPSRFYGERLLGMPIIVVSSWGYYEVAINGGSAASQLGLNRGDSVIVPFPNGQTQA